MSRLKDHFDFQSEKYNTPDEVIEVMDHLYETIDRSPIAVEDVRRYLKDYMDLYEGESKSTIRLRLSAEAKDGETLLEKAIKNGNEEVVDELLNARVTVKKEALFAAADTYPFNEGIMFKLMDEAVSPNAQDEEDKNRTALHKVIRASQKKGHAYAMVHILLDEGLADPNIQDKYGNTAMHTAAKRLNGNELNKTLDEMLYREADPNIQNHDGNTPLHEIVERLDGQELVSALNIVFSKKYAKRVDLTIRNNEGNTVYDIVKDMHEMSPTDDKLEEAMDIVKAAKKSHTTSSSKKSKEKHAVRGPHTRKHIEREERERSSRSHGRDR